MKGRATSAPMLAKASTTKTAPAIGKGQGPGMMAAHPPTSDEIARRSYEIFLERGSEHGHALEHWIQAERDLGA